MQHEVRTQEDDMIAENAMSYRMTNSTKTSRPRRRDQILSLAGRCAFQPKQKMSSRVAETPKTPCRLVPLSCQVSTWEFQYGQRPNALSMLSCILCPEVVTAWRASCIDLFSSFMVRMASSRACVRERSRRTSARRAMMGAGARL